MKKNKNITLNAPSDLIEKAREKAKRQKFSLNKLFQIWLEKYTGSKNIDYETYIREFDHIESGQKFSRDEMNER